MSWGIRITLRTGVNTGEVVAGDGAQSESFATGDAVNVAARLEQAAGPGEILLGDATRRLLRDAIRVEAVEPLALKGKTEPVQAWRLSRFSPTSRPSRASSALPSSGASASSPSSKTRSSAWPPRAILPTRHRARPARNRQVEARARARLGGRRAGPGRGRALRAVRGGDHVLAAGRDRPAGGRSRPRRDRRARRRRRERRADRGTDRRRGRARRGGRPKRGDRLGRAQALRGARARAPADRRPRRHPLGRADVPRPDRVSRRLHGADRFCSSRSRGPTCSTSAPPGPRPGRTRAQSCSSRSPRGRRRC